MWFDKLRQQFTTSAPARSPQGTNSQQGCLDYSAPVVDAVLILPNLLIWQIAR
jgi:hypothetical protein